MVIRASVLLFLLTTSATRCLSERLSLADESHREVGNNDDNEKGNIDDENSSEKRLSDLGISKSDLQRVITEAEEEVKRDVPKILDESSKASSRMTYQARHYRAKYDPESKERTRQALTAERVMEKLAKKLRLSNDEAAAKLTGLQIKKTVNGKCGNIKCDKDKRYRELDGMCNNLKNPCWGAINTPFGRLLRPDYADKRAKPRESKDRNKPLPNPRLFSFNVFEDQNSPSPSLSHMTMIWGQFIDHDIVLKEEQVLNCPTKHQDCTSGPNRGECFGVPVPPSDPHFLKNGVKCLHVIRSTPAGATKCDCASTLGYREQSNTITAFIDASQVYGADKKTLDSLRIPGSSLLRFQDSENLLPQEKPGEGFFSCRDDCGKQCFKAGDIRVNDNPGLASMHTLFMREHNRIAGIFTSRNPSWTVDRVFEETRKIIGAQIQHITYNEFLPIILNNGTRKHFGLELLSKNFSTGYKESINPSIINSFATAAYRMGHSLVQNSFSRPGKSAVPTKNFFNPCPVYDGTDSIFGGLATDPAQTVDRFFSDAITQSLVLGPDIVIDLPAINIQRGRDHGLPGYNEFRRLSGLNKAKSFDDLRGQMSKPNRAKLGKFYNHVDDVDLYAGGIMEEPVPGGVLGPTFSYLIASQFRVLRHGDRFWYENYDRTTGFTTAQLAEIRKVSLARLICDHNQFLEDIQPRVMARSGKDQTKRCDELPKMDLSAW